VTEPGLRPSRSRVRVSWGVIVLSVGVNLKLLQGSGYRDCNPGMPLAFIGPVAVTLTASGRLRVTGRAQVTEYLESRCRARAYDSSIAGASESR
jgi:hypothetical protein